MTIAAVLVLSLWYLAVTLEYGTLLSFSEGFACRCELLGLFGRVSEAALEVH